MDPAIDLLGQLAAGRHSAHSILECLPPLLQLSNLLERNLSVAVLGRRRPLVARIAGRQRGQARMVHAEKPGFLPALTTSFIDLASTGETIGTKAFAEACANVLPIFDHIVS